MKMSAQANNFAAIHRPARRESRLTPHAHDIIALRGLGFTLSQICAFLAEAGVTTSIAALSSWLKRQEEKYEKSRTDKTGPDCRVMPPRPPLSPKTQKPATPGLDSNGNVTNDFFNLLRKGNTE
jgi:hypothetical protein